MLSGWLRWSILRIDVGLDGSLEGLGIGADNLSDLVAALEKKEGGHSANAEFLGNVGDFVYVDLEEANRGVLVGEPSSLLEPLLLLAHGNGNLLYDLGSNDLTRAAPCREAVKHHE
jgi:hypothetical protein